MIKTRKRIDLAIEKKIIMGMIVSSEYMHEVLPLINFDYFRNKYTRILAKWSCNYYEKYGKSMFKDVEDVFLKRQDTLDASDADLIEKLLIDMSKRYEVDPKINTAYLLDYTIEYFKKREMEIRMGNVQVLLDNGQVEDAVEQMLMFNAPEKMRSDWSRPFYNETPLGLFYRNDAAFFQFPGSLGDFLGEMYPGWLVGITGAFKRGKTFFLLEFAIVGMLLGLSVAFFSLEMPLVDIIERIYKRICGATVDNFVFPCFDCYYNQEDTCTKTKRTNNRRLLDAAGEKPEYSSNIRYKSCTWCRYEAPDEYKMATWFEEIQVEKFDYPVVKKYQELFEKHYGNKLRIRAYPKFSANVRDMERDLNILYRTENFLPNIIIVDHADILRGENNDMVGVEKEDTTWMSLGRLAGERNALVVTGTQATRQALDSANLRTKHTARWIGKLGHVDVMMTLNQTDKEKKDGVIRVGIMEHRHRHFLETETVTVLQKLSAGQVHLDSEK